MKLRMQISGPHIPYVCGAVVVSPTGKCMASFAFKRYVYPMPLWPGQSTPRLNSSREILIEEIMRYPDAHPPVKDDVDAES